MAHDIILQGISLKGLEEMIRAVIREGHKEELLSKKEAAEFLGVHTSAIDTYCRDHGLIRYKRGNSGHPVFKKSDILNWLKPLEG